MALFLKPHTATYKPAVKTTASLGGATATTRVDRPASSGTLKGQLTYKTPSDIYQSWGLEVERPAIFLYDDNTLNLKTGGWLSITGLDFVVKRIRKAGAMAIVDHFEALLERVDNTGGV